MLTPNLDEPFYPSLWTFANSVGVPAEWFLNFFFIESYLDPMAYNGKYAGLNQLDQVYLKNKFGIELADYLKMPASSQLTRAIAPYLTGVLKTLGKPLRSPGVLYAMNFYSASVLHRGDSPDTIIVSKYASDPQEVRAYYANTNKGRPDPSGHCGLDYDCSGEVTIGDLDQLLYDKTQSPVYQKYLTKLHQYGSSNGREIVPLPSPIGKVVKTILGGLAFGLVGTMAYMEYTKGRAWHR